MTDWAKRADVADRCAVVLFVFGMVLFVVGFFYLVGPYWAALILGTLTIVFSFRLSEKGDEFRKRASRGGDDQD